MSRMLHATDFFRASQPAFRLAVDWAKRGRAELRHLHVRPLPSVAERVVARASCPVLTVRAA